VPLAKAMMKYEGLKIFLSAPKIVFLQNASEKNIPFLVQLDKFLFILVL
jgi:hypothetical protein